MKVLKDFLGWLWRLFVPSRCPICGELGETGPCEKCRRILPDQPYLQTLSLPGKPRVLVAAPLRYQGEWKKTLHRFKFRDVPALDRSIASLTAGAAQRLPGPFDCVAYVPLHKKDRRKRGYDQSELLAKEVGRALSLPCVPLLEKCRQTETQHNLNRAQRLENPEGAYRARQPAAGLSVLLVDDIVTTGATLSQCALALYAAGAKKVCCLCAAEASPKSS